MACWKGFWFVFLFCSVLMAHIGAPCKTDKDCGNKELCLSKFQDGYCVEYDCSVKNPCVQDAQCVSVSPEDFTLCLAKCSKNQDCRKGYRCYEQGVCLP